MRTKLRRPKKIWSHPKTDPASELEIAERLNIPTAIASILSKRGLNTTEKINRFLNPTLQQLASPTLMKGMTQAVELLHKAIVEKQTIAIFGDYDADGITGSALLYLFLKEAGFKVIAYHPDRFSEGYGLSSQGLNILKTRIEEEQGGYLSQGHSSHRAPQEHSFHSGLHSVLITVDCGISNFNEVAEARKLGFSVIITDHHTPPERLPEADAILNPHQKGCTFPFKELAGVGVAFYLAMGLRSHLVNKQYWTTETAPNLKEYLDLTAIGTIADLVPLTGINRILTKAGLEIIKISKRPGIQEMLKNAKLDAKTIIYASDIAFQIGPRINAASRMEGRPDISFSLLTTKNQDEATILSDKLETINEQRKALTESIYEEALGYTESIMTESKNSIVIFKPEWHPGITGLVASRLMNHYYKPIVILWQSEDGYIKGSCRSIPELNIIEVLTSCSEKLKSYGGHRGAAGLSLEPGNLKKFIEAFEQEVSAKIGAMELSPQILIDHQIEIPVEVLSNEFTSQLNRLQPFGKGNPEPIFSTFQPIFLENTRKVGRDSMKFTWSNDGTEYRGIGFGFADSIPEVLNQKIVIAFTIQTNNFKGREQVEIKLEDFNLNTTI
ncbi:MAG: single-stranded-DNA-specific exonuclease RecJ [Proteobacteria bacterium]|nr:single-stranded-DNA-specific exonuclease RecJ [Pseudomonadota bacterium]MBU1716489.1 single-stranded-DNA-specific exonuclease RecJ [Pseudomonadota bacterium]